MTESTSHRKPSMAVRGLVVIALAIATGQLVATRFGEQSSWKGGGFGMYTDPHPQNRKVWLVLEAEGGAEHAIALWPITDSLRANAGRPGADGLNRAVRLAYELSTSVDPARAAALAGLGQGLGWHLADDGTPVLAEGTPLEITGARVEVNELRYDIAGRRITVERVDAGTL